MTRVLMVLPRYLPVIGGAEVQCSRLVSSLQSHTDITVTGIVTRRIYSGLKAKEEIDGASVCRLPPGGTGLFSEYIFCLLLFFYLIYNRKKFDVLHCHASSIFGITVSFAGALLRKKALVKISTNGEIYSMQKNPIKRKVCALASKYCTFIALNNEGFEEIKECIPGASALIIPNGIDFKRETYSDLFEAQTIRESISAKYGDVFLCVFIGRFVHRKGVKDLLTVADALVKSGHENILFLMVGDSALQRDAELTDNINIKNVIVVGKKENVFPYLLAADVFVSPSYNEGLPNTVLEALSCGRHCVLSDIKPHIELYLEHKGHISLFPSKNTSAFLDEIKTVSSRMSDTYIYEQPKNVLINKYSIVNVSNMYAEIYKV